MYVWVIQNAQAHDRVCACVFAQTLIVVSIFTLFLASFLYKHYITSKNGLPTNCHRAVQCGLKWLRSGIIKWTPFEMQNAAICKTIRVRMRKTKITLVFSFSFFWSKWFQMSIEFIWFLHGKIQKDFIGTFFCHTFQVYRAFYCNNKKWEMLRNEFKSQSMVVCRRRGTFRPFIVIDCWVWGGRLISRSTRALTPTA